MNVDEASQPAAVSGKRVLRMVWWVPRVLSWCVGTCCRTCPSWLLSGLVVAILWLAGIGIIWTDNRRFSGQLQQAVQDIRSVSRPRLLSMLYGPQSADESGNVATGAHVRTRSAAVVAFVQLSRPVAPAARAAAQRPARLINLQGLDLPGAQLAETDLKGVDFSSANLKSLDLRGADLLASNFSQANLEDVRFRGAQLQGANLEGVDFRESAGLTLPQVQRAKNWRLALFRQTDWVGQEDP